MFLVMPPTQHINLEVSQRLVHCCALSLCYPGCETGYRVGTWSSPKSSSWAASHQRQDLEDDLARFDLCNIFYMLREGKGISADLYLQSCNCFRQCSPPVTPWEQNKDYDSVCSSPASSKFTPIQPSCSCDLRNIRWLFNLRVYSCLG